MRGGSVLFDREREEQRLNSIFSQIDCDNEGQRNNAATIIREWMEKNRRVDHGLQLRLVLKGSAAERNLRIIDQQERKIEKLQREIDELRKSSNKTDLRSIERRRKAAEGPSYHVEFIQAIKEHLYGGQYPEVPRGAGKIVARILSYSKSTVGAMLHGERPVTLPEVEKIRRAPPIPARPASAKQNSSGGGKSGTGSRRGVSEVRLPTL
jgi:hypothetical protein